MADNVTFTAGANTSPPAGTVASTEEITTLNGGSVSAQHVQRVVNALRTSDGVAVDLPGDAANGLDVDVTRVASLPLPTGAATLAEQQAQTTALQLIDDVIATDGTAALAKGAQVAGTDGANAQILKTDAAGELQVDVLSLPAIPAGNNNIGDVDVASLPALPAGTNNIGDVDVLTLPVLPAGNNNIGDVDVASLPALPAGTNNIGDVDVASLPAPHSKTADFDSGGGTDTVAMYGIALPASGGAVAGGTSANPVRTDPTGTTTQPVSGTVTANLAAGTNNIGDVDVLSVVPGTGATALGKAEDAAAGSGDTGVAVLAVRRDSASSGVDADGDYANLSVDSTGALRVTGGGGGTQFAEDAAHNSGDQGTMSLGIRRDADTTPVSADNDYHPMVFDANGNLKVAIKSGGGSGGTAQTDEAGFTAGATAGTPVMGARDDTSPDTLAEGTVGIIRATTNRALHVNLRDASGNELAVGGGTQYDEDTAHVTADKLTLAGAVRRDTAASGVDADGDRATLNVNSAGRLYAAATIDAALPAGTNNIGDVDVLSLPALPAGTNNIGDVDVASLPALPAGTNNIGDVDVLSVVPGTGATALGKAEDDPHASGDVGILALAVRRDTAAVGSGADGDNSTLNVNASGRLYTSTTVDAALPAGNNNIGDVDVASLPALSAGTNNIGDVDVLSVVPGTGATALGKAEDDAHASGDVGVLALAVRRDTAAVGSGADGDNSTLNVNASGRLYTSTTVDAALPAGTNNIGDVDVLTLPALPAGTNNIGDVDIVSLPNEGQQTMANSISVAVASDQSVLPVGGNVAHDAADAGNPAKIGAKAIDHGANPTAVAANDRTDLYANRHGILWTIGGHPNVICTEFQIQDADGAQTNLSLTGTIATGTKVCVTMVQVTADAANTAGTACRIGFGATAVPTPTQAGVNGVILAHEGIPPGGGVIAGNGGAVIGVGADGEELRMTCEDPAGGNLSVIVHYFTIPA